MPYQGKQCVNNRNVVGTIPNYYLNVFVKPNEQCRACSDIVMARKRTFEERKKNVFVKPNEQCRACSDIVMARKRTFEERKKNVFVKPNEQCRACSDIVMARIGNRQHGALGEVERQNALLRNEKRTFYSSQHRLLFQTNMSCQSFFTFDITG